MGMFSSCSACHSEWCSGAECVRISPENLRKASQRIPVDYADVADALSIVADYLDANPDVLRDILVFLKKD